MDFRAESGWHPACFGMSAIAWLPLLQRLHRQHMPDLRHAILENHRAPPDVQMNWQRFAGSPPGSAMSISFLAPMELVYQVHVAKELRKYNAHKSCMLSLRAGNVHLAGSQASGLTGRPSACVLPLKQPCLFKRGLQATSDLQAA